jgi:biopolymer transport protein ExbD
MASKVLEEAKQELKMDMTPMIDCVFLLIIFFLCIDFRTLESKLPAYLPKDSGAQSTPEEPIEKLSLRIECTNPGKAVTRKDGTPIALTARDAKGHGIPHRLVGHTVRYHVGPVPVSNVDDLLRELKKVYADKTKWRVDPAKGGEKQPMPVVIEPGPEVVYADAAVCVDAVSAAGFKDIQFGGGLGRTKRAQ